MDIKYKFIFRNIVMDFSVSSARAILSDHVGLLQVGGSSYLHLSLPFDGTFMLMSNYFYKTDHQVF